MHFSFVTYARYAPSSQINLMLKNLIQIVQTADENEYILKIFTP